MVSVLKKTEEELGINITFSVETEPLGTAGPLALAKEILGKDDSPFFVLNADVTCTYPFEAFRLVPFVLQELWTAMLTSSDFHMAHGCEGSIMVSSFSLRSGSPTFPSIELAVRLLTSRSPKSPSLPTTVSSSQSPTRQSLIDSSKSQSNS